MEEKEVKKKLASMVKIQVIKEIFDSIPPDELQEIQEFFYQHIPPAPK